MRYYTLIILLICFLYFPSSLFAQVDNDDCPNAVLIDNIEIDIEQCISGTNEGAVAELPFINQQNCQGVLAPHSAADIWYQFTGLASLLSVELTSSLSPIVVSLYEGDCMTLLGRDCAIGENGAVKMNQIQISTGQQYFLQISGGTAADFSTFELCLRNYESENEVCIGNQELQITPTPILNSFELNTKVSFCLEIENYFLEGFDYLHGIVPVFGAGWDQTSLQVTPPESCDTKGQWIWVESVLSINADNQQETGEQGPGFFYDSTIGTETTSPSLDGDPGNNYGDNPEGQNCNWRFCFDITTITTCPSNAAEKDLGIRFLNFADSETGSVASISNCQADSEFLFKASLNCCKAPELDIVVPSCDNPTSGSLTANASGEAPFNFSWSTGFTESNQSASTLDNLGTGYYAVTVTDNLNCVSAASHTFPENANLVITIDSQEDASCGVSSGSIRLSVSGGQAPYNFTLNDTLTVTDGIFEELGAAIHQITVIDAQQCSANQTISLSASDSPSATTTVSQPDCNKDQFTGSIKVNAIGGVPPYTYSINGAAPQDSPDLTELVPQVYQIFINDANDCGTFISETIVATPMLNADLGADREIFLGDTTTLDAGIIDSETLSYSWTVVNHLVPACDNCPQAIAFPSETSTYQLTISNEEGCFVSDEITIVVIQKETTPLVPNAFSPNDDQINDFFAPILSNESAINQYNMQIFNRWGEEIFHSVDIDIQWDGKHKLEALPIGNYMYYIHYEEGGNTKELKGTVFLMR